jgi:hypothetical protein
MSPRLCIGYHGNCFDGVVSAAILTRFFGERAYPGQEVSYLGLAHSRTDPYGEDHAAFFSAEVNAVVDFRYSSSPRLTWWCDHHQTTFIRPTDRDHLAADRTGRKCFDPSAPSCAGLLARWLARQHGFSVEAFEDHVRWADVIDSASFASPTQAVELREPALQLMSLLEAAPEMELTESLIRGLSLDTLERVHAEPRIRQALVPVLEEHTRTIELFRARLLVERGVAYFDLARDGVEGFNKFIPYYLVPELSYTVGLTVSPKRAKISVGSNPWNRPSPLLNLGELCGRYGGGGHAVVGAVTLPSSEEETARQAALEIVEILRGSRD